MKWSEIEGLLPAVFQRGVLPGSPLRALLEAMEALNAPDEEVLADLPSCFDPYTAPEEMVPFLAMWVDLGWLLAGHSAAGQDRDETPVLVTGLGRLRELVAAAADLARWRGTARGLARFLETATGVPGFEVDDAVVEQGCIRPFHIRVRAPAGARAFEALVRQIVEMEKPVYVTHGVEWGAEAGGPGPGRKG